MATVEVIGLMCAGSVRYHEALGGGGCPGQLSRAELAGLLSGLSCTAMNLALAKYAGDLDAERSLIAQVRVWAAGMAIREHWAIVRGRPTVVNMAALSVFEVVRPNRCPQCQGRGVENVRICSCCDGTGYKALSGRVVADAIGVAETSYRDVWRGRYEQCIRHVQDIDGQVNRVIRLADREQDYSYV